MDKNEQEWTKMDRNIQKKIDRNKKLTWFFRKALVNEANINM